MSERSERRAARLSEAEIEGEVCEIEGDAAACLSVRTIDAEADRQRLLLVAAHDGLCHEDGFALRRCG
jgi:hypothetical protein